MNRFRRGVALATVALLPLTGAACGDDDNDGEAEIEAPEVDVRPDNDTNTAPGDGVNP